jgi:hypothetical protein
MDAVVDEARNHCVLVNTDARVEPLADLDFGEEETSPL